MRLEVISSTPRCPCRPDSLSNNAILTLNLIGLPSVDTFLYVPVMINVLHAIYCSRAYQDAFTCNDIKKIKSNNSVDIVKVIKGKNS